ncbi:MAG: radical SAM/SPASM domain-containing protein [Roseburia sp.]
MNFNLEQYLTDGVIHLVHEITKLSIKNPKTSLFMAQYALSNKSANKKRKEAEEKGEHIPPFLIASITSKCNLHCKGCYARANQNCTDSDTASKKLLATEDWNRIFDEAEELGIAFILLAGGEPFLRQDVLISAGLHKKILFPIFTNGTLLTEQGMNLLEEYPNLLPILSIEGNQTQTDERRGDGIYRKLSESMTMLKQKSKLFGCSVTVQKNNLSDVMDDSFVQQMSQTGCKAIIYVEFVPVDPNTEAIAPGEKERAYIADRLTKLRADFPEMIFLSFPGDEQAMGGCLASGRGFFHINAYGGAEPCPFSAFSDCTLKEHSLKEALNSPLFVKLRNSGILDETHVGGCTLFQKEDTIKEFLGGNA